LANQADRILTMQDGVLTENQNHTSTPAERFGAERNSNEPVIAESGEYY
jgi:hypothetical protein